MKKLGKNIEYLIADLAGDSSKARLHYRTRQVRERYRQVLESVYNEMATYFLEHTNNVYIMDKDGVKTLIVYVDESIFAAELNAQRELIKLKLLELFGEEIEEFEIYISRGKYKDNHPYLDDESLPSQKIAPLKPLGEKEERFVEDVASTVEDERLRKSLKKAMTADIARNMAENGEES